MSTIEQIEEKRKELQELKNRYLYEIPEITHPDGKYWDQPERSEILVDKANALMSINTFNKLKDYSQSNPSGVYDGKMWRSRTKLGTNHFHWYAPCKTDPKLCIVETRIIILI